MANYLTTDTELTSIANAIRTKGGTNAQLTFPTGFVTAINNISTGGAAEVAATLYTANTGNKNSFSLDNNGGYYIGDPAIFNAVINYAQYGMVADSNGYVIWKGKLISNMFPYTGGIGDTYLYTGGGVAIMANTYMMMIPGDIDPETGEQMPDTEEDIQEVSIATDPHATTVYISSVAF